MRTLAAISLLTLCAAGRAETVVPFTVTSPEDRANAIVRLPLPNAGEGWERRAARVADSANAAYPAQVVRRLRFAQPEPSQYAEPTTVYELVVQVPKLLAAAPLNLRAAIGDGPAPAEGFTVSGDELRVDGKPRLRLMGEDYNPATKESLFRTYKVYHHLFDADGSSRLTNGPEGQFPHHRGIFFGFNKVSYGGKTADVWHCTKGAHQRLVSRRAADGGPLAGRHALTIDWVGQDGKAFAREERELLAVALPGGLALDFTSTLSTTLPKVRLDGDPQHAGFHFRANVEVEKKSATATYFVRPDGKGKAGDQRNWEPKTRQGPANLPWNAMCFELEGKKHTVLYIDRPDNPKEARQSERTYGRLGTYFEHDLLAGKPLTVRYRLVVRPGEMTADECAALAADFARPATAAPGGPAPVGANGTP